MKTGIIYGYTNLESGKMYIGQTLYPQRIYKAHRYGKYKNGWHKDYQNKGLQTGEKNPMYGKKHSDEAKAKVSKANKGKHWYNNGIKNITAFECPSGYKTGRL